MLNHWTNVIFPLLLCRKILSQGKGKKIPKYFSSASLTFILLKSKLVLCMASQEHVTSAK